MKSIIGVRKRSQAMERHQTGDLIGNRFRIEGILGQGGVGTTYRAIDERIQTPVALKALYFTHLQDWKALDLFAREAQVLQQLTHPQIPQYLDYFQVDRDGDRGFYIAQTLVEGQSLAQRIETGWRGSEVEIKAIAERVLEILIYLHHLKPPVIHRDIKPQNLIRQADDSIFLVDFGSVQNIYSQTEIEGSTIVGTYGYMPPEQYRGKAYAATDLYSLGATLLYLLSGSLPTDFPHRRLKIDFRDRLDISLTFADWLERMLEPTLEARFHSAREALQALHNPSSLLPPLDPNAPIIKSSWIKFQRSPERLKIEFPATNNVLQALQLACTRGGLIALTVFWAIVTFNVTKRAIAAGFSYYSSLLLFLSWFLLPTSLLIIIKVLHYRYQGVKLFLARMGWSLFFVFDLIWSLYYTRVAIRAGSVPSLTVFLFWGILALLLICLKYLFERTILTIDRQKVELTYRLLFYQQRGREKTKNLARASSGESVFKEFEKLRWTIRAVQLNYIDKSYRFGTRLKQIEREWIVREINRFLVEISRSRF